MTNPENINPAELSAQLKEIHGNMQESIVILFNQLVAIDNMACKLSKGGVSNE